MLFQGRCLIRRLTIRRLGHGRAPSSVFPVLSTPRPIVCSNERACRPFIACHSLHRCGFAPCRVRPRVCIARRRQRPSGSTESAYGSQPWPLGAVIGPTHRKAPVPALKVFVMLVGGDRIGRLRPRSLGRSAIAPVEASFGFVQNQIGTSRRRAKGREVCESKFSQEVIYTMQKKLRPHVLETVGMWMSKTASCASSSRQKVAKFPGPVGTTGASSGV